MAQYKEAKQKILNAENRPVKWEQVNFRLVPQQEGEDYLNEVRFLLS